MTVSIVSLFGVVQIGGNVVPDTLSETDSTYLASDENIRHDAAAPTAVSIDRAQDGLFHVTALVNGKPVDMAIDTGATRTIVAPADAERIGLFPHAGTYSNMETLNGRVRLSRIKIDKLTVGNREMKGLEIVLGPRTLNQSVVGLDAISRSGPLLVEGNRVTLLATKSRATSE
ncbi:MAG: TIGR02281 family clan AA aspartic protease [Parasphingorhabdus sp.]|uniref:retropepsin-like aspartic protease family protein n=1 Tax=Parasphingorhabdus sp. TaxID=2709688 RepID=UPI00300358AD